MRGKLGTIIAIYAAVLSTVSTAWIAWKQIGRNEIVCERATIGLLTVQKVFVKDQGKDLVVVGKSSVTGGGAFALMNRDGTQCAVLSDGALALSGADAETESKELSSLHGFSLVFGASKDSATVAMKGDRGYEVVLESGKTSDDPLGIRGGRINLGSAGRSVRVDSSGAQEAPSRNW